MEQAEIDQCMEEWLKGWRYATMNPTGELSTATGAEYILGHQQGKQAMKQAQAAHRKELTDHPSTQSNTPSQTRGGRLRTMEGK